MDGQNRSMETKSFKLIESDEGETALIDIEAPQFPRNEEEWQAVIAFSWSEWDHRQGIFTTEGPVDDAWMHLPLSSFSEQQRRV